MATWFSTCKRKTNSYLILAAGIIIPWNCVKTSTKNGNHTHWGTKKWSILPYKTRYDRSDTWDNSSFVKTIPNINPPTSFIAQSGRFHNNVINFGFQSLIKLGFEFLKSHTIIVHFSNYPVGRFLCQRHSYSISISRRGSSIWRNFFTANVNMFSIDLLAIKNFYSLSSWFIIVTVWLEAAWHCLQFQLLFVFVDCLLRKIGEVGGRWSRQDGRDFGLFYFSDDFISAFYMLRTKINILDVMIFVSLGLSCSVLLFCDGWKQNTTKIFWSCVKL